jgi:hypothetical protein
MIARRVFQSLLHKMTKKTFNAVQFVSPRASNQVCLQVLALVGLYSLGIIEVETLSSEAFGRRDATHETGSVHVCLFSEFATIMLNLSGMERESKDYPYRSACCGKCIGPVCIYIC